jgi:protein-S-isoprenylcysteine O-methyltransferase Ste14
VQRARAAAGSLVFLVAAPGVVAGLVPWLLTRWHGHHAPAWLQAAGAAAVTAGGLVLLDAFRRFVADGLGTPAPVAPTQILVVRGPYRYVRNPMYLAVASVILGQAMLLARWQLVAYAGLFGAAVWSFVHWYEEPVLARRFGAEYEAYLDAVPGWWPRRPRPAEGPRHA